MNKNREGVWIVQHDETPHNTVLRVSRRPRRRQSRPTVHVNYADGVITMAFPIGFRFEDGAARYRR